MVEEMSLLGRWRSDPSDEIGLRQYGTVTLVFEAGGKLIHISHSQGRDEIINLSFRLEDGVLVTDQPSSPGEERTKFKVTPEGKLVLEFGGVPSTFVRAD